MKNSKIQLIALFLIIYFRNNYCKIRIFKPVANCDCKTLMDYMLQNELIQICGTMFYWSYRHSSPIPTPQLGRRFALTKQTSTEKHTTSQYHSTSFEGGSARSPGGHLYNSNLSGSRPKLCQLRGNNKEVDDVTTPVEPPPFFSDKIDPER